VVGWGGNRELESITYPNILNINFVNFIASIKISSDRGGQRSNCGGCGRNYTADFYVRLYMRKLRPSIPNY
jgi:hypothetical protein